MTRYSITAAAVLLLACFAYGETGTSSIWVVTDQGAFIETVTGEYTPAAELQPMYDPPEVLWHYSTTTGGIQQIAPMGYESGYVFTGGYYGGAKMFQGVTGDGSVLWSYAPVGNCKATGTAAAKTADIFYSIFNWSGNSIINCFNGESDTPVWTYTGTGTININYWVDVPGNYACSADGSVFAVAASIQGHLAILFFNPSGSIPFAIYEDVNYLSPSGLRITADGSKCIFRTNDNIFRVDTATGTLEASYAQDEINGCFGISTDGSVIAYGFTAAKIAVWDGSAYNLEAELAVSGYLGYSATLAADNSTVYFGFYKANFTTNRIIRYDLDTSTEVWTYDYPIGSGEYQDILTWMECSNDGRWLVAGSLGSQIGGGDEVNVFDDLNPSAPVFSIDTPGSINHVDISHDGRYVSAAGKHVHSNEIGAGTDVYMCEVDITGIEGGVSAPSHFMACPNPSSGSFTVNFTAAEPCVASIELFDLGGRLVHSEESSVSQGGDALMQVSTDLPSGIYTCRLSAGNEENTTRLVITR